MKLITFTLTEATEALREIEPRVQRLVAAKREFDKVQVRIAVLDLAVAGATRDNPDALELQTLHDQRNRVADTISKEVAAIHRRGCLVKDLDKGLVDFHALSGDRLVFLCWQLGEHGIHYWHTLDGGYASRQALPQIDVE